MKKFTNSGQFKKIEITIGAIYNKWEVIGHSHQNSSGNYYWVCKCKCGIIKPVAAHRVVNGESKSCGCNRRSDMINRKHGLKYHPLYNKWNAMKYRCYNQNAHNYSLYGGRGIKVCDRWLKSVENFYNDMINGYEKGMHLDRIDVNGDYSPENCRWLTCEQNNNNKRINWRVSFDGRTHTPTEWSKELGIKANTIQSRKRKGWTDYESLFGLK